MANRGLPPDAQSQTPVHAWLRANRSLLPDGDSQHRCPVSEMADGTAFEVMLTVKISPLGGRSPGSLQIGRQQISNDFSEVMRKALRNKLPELIATPADKRILIFEREDFNFFPEQIVDEIENQRPAFSSELSRVDEIWILETVFYQPGGHLQFDLYKENRVIASLQFQGGELTGRSANGMPVPMSY